MSSELSRFMIDDYLKRYRKAMGHLRQCVPQKTFDDILAYINKHDLYKDAMQIYKQQREQFDVISSETRLTIGRLTFLCRLSR